MKGRVTHSKSLGRNTPETAAGFGAAGVRTPTDFMHLDANTRMAIELEKELMQKAAGPNQQVLTCMCYEPYPDRCGKPATHDTIHGEPFNCKVANCEYHAAIAEHMGLQVARRPNSVLADATPETNPRK